MRTRPKLKFGALEVGRGFAASAVVLHHAGNIVAQPRFFAARPFGGRLGNFNVGVDFFFVLSGFIITWIHWEDIGDRSRVADYARKRFLRIYPPYWGLVVPLILLYLVFPRAGLPSQRDPANILCSVLLLPYLTQPVLGVAWTLTNEIFFYILFAPIIALGYRYLLVLPLWAAAILIAHAFAPLPYPAAFFLSPFNLEFIMGVGAAALLRRRDMPFPELLMAAGALGFVAMMVFAQHIQDDPLVGRLALGAAATAFVLGSVELERRRPWELPRWLAFFGASSYAVYLCHPIALSALVSLVTRLGGRHLPLAAVVVIMAALAIAAGMLYHLLVERKLIALARGWLKQPNGKP